MRQVFELRLARLPLDRGVFERPEAEPEQLDGMDDADPHLRRAGLERDVEPAGSRPSTTGWSGCARWTARSFRPRAASWSRATGWSAG